MRAVLPDWSTVHHRAWGPVLNPAIWAVGLFAYWPFLPELGSTIHIPNHSLRFASGCAA